MRIISKSIIFVVILTLALNTNLFAHNVPDGNARTERIREYPVNSNLAEIDGNIEFGNPTIRDGGWSWMALSISNPLLADCHSGTTTPSALRVVRVGWIKKSGYQYAREMSAWIGNNNVINVNITMTNVTGPKKYRVHATDVDNNPGDWHFESRPFNTGTWTTIGYTSTGPNHNQMKCVTVGGWASSFSNAIGTAAIYSIFVNNGPSLWVPDHSVINSPYQSIWVPALQGYQYSGNN